MIATIGQDDHEGAEIEARLGHDGQAEPEESVGAHLQEDAGQKHAAGRRRLGVGGRAARCGTGTSGTLIAKAMAKARKTQIWKCEAVAPEHRLGDAEGAVHEVQGDDRHQEEDAPEQGVDEELERGVDPCCGPPQTAMSRYIGMSIASQKT